MAYDAKLVPLLNKLIADGRQMLTHVRSDRLSQLKCISDEAGLRRWSNELILFKSLATDLIRPWSKILVHDGTVVLAHHLEVPLSALETIRDAMDQGLLARFEDLVIASAFADLSEQARYLLSQGYFLAAGVIFRAVFEERIRKLCERNRCMPASLRPTIGDLNTALYKATPPVYDKTMMHQVTALAAIGNDAAHNNPALKIEDVERLATGVQDFLARFST